MNCPQCGAEIPRTEAQREASRRNGAKGGRPRKDAKKLKRRKAAKAEGADDA